MILSPGRSYVFVHIPKTGGTALSLALEARAMADDMMLGDTPKATRRRRRLKGVKTRGRLWKHSTLADIDGLVPAADLRRLFAFTLVRNPFDRVLSLYHWLRAQSFDHPSVPLAKTLDFVDFACHPKMLAAFRATPARAYMRRADGVEQCACYIRLEHFAQDAAPLFDHLGFELRLPVANVSDRPRGWQGAYTDAARMAVAEACAMDLAQFEYSFNDSPIDQ
ncbi:Sulfotransferase family protein [Phaeobacter piscinae]|uniref:Sulfotransferase family protein n=1 Tax=Phaeobacter piscinae TaxID=1580596 RepID=A0AAN1GQG1_9RHOB|nr:sulfotransferase family 2 domain-containing protein [Phaeobacter piscinae]ATG43074.1 Sulfotransferase family protein [Phaeobacter piscinae]AUR35392.1 Sulfotransferase family protein [Phaeobacter piscinae]